LWDKRPHFETAPSTATDLHAYNMYVLPDMHGEPRAGGHGNDGKVNPSKYGSIKELDLGLCYETFFSDKDCRHGGRCRWRHAFFRPEERSWISSLGAKGVVDLMEYAWRTPHAPVCSAFDIQRGLAA